jgi:hypothetical protein
LHLSAERHSTQRWHGEQHRALRRPASKDLHESGSACSPVVAILGACLSNRQIFLGGSASQILSFGMSKTFRPWRIDEPLLLPVTAADFVGESHLARFVLSVVRDEIDLAGLCRCSSHAAIQPDGGDEEGLF